MALFLKYFFQFVCWFVISVVSPAQGSVAESVTRVHNKEMEMSEKWRKILEKGPEPRVVLEPLGSQSQILSPSTKPPQQPKAVRTSRSCITVVRWDK
jgi:hypothetical protein